MSNIQIVNVSTAAQDFLDDMEEFNKISLNERSSPIIKFPHDPVACACASYRIWKSNNSNRWGDLDSITPTAEDIEKAEQLKRYYRDHLLVETLKQPNGKTRSEFRRKLALLVINELPITSREIGMLHRLPYFYQEDLDLDAVVAETNCRIEFQIPNPRTVEKCTLIPLRRMLRSRNAAEYYHYWFKDTVHNHPYDLVVKTDNPLVSLIDGLFQLPELKISAFAFNKSFKGYHQSKQYYQLANPKLIS